MNPINIAQVINTIREAGDKKCPHCGRVYHYQPKQRGQFYTCKGCQKRFKEKGQ